MTYTVQGKPSAFPPCGYCGASYEAHEEVLEYGDIRGHRINRPDQPQHGMYHSFSPMPPNAHGLCEKDNDVDTSNWPGGWIDVKDTEPPKHVPLLCCDKSGFMFVATYDGSGFQCNCTFNFVTYWMLAPSTPKPKREWGLIDILRTAISTDSVIIVNGYLARVSSIEVNTSDGVAGSVTVTMRENYDR